MEITCLEVELRSEMCIRGSLIWHPFFRISVCVWGGGSFIHKWEPNSVRTLSIPSVPPICKDWNIRAIGDMVSVISYL